MKKIIIFIVIVTAIVGALGFWNWQKYNYSKDTLELEILGPETINMGEEFEYVVTYKNNGAVRLEEAKLIFEFPKHSVVSDGKASWQEITLEDIYPRQEKTIRFKTRLLGKEGEVFTAKASLSYRPKDLKASNKSSTSLTTTIKSVPVTFEFDLPSRAAAGKDFDFRINYFSNLNYLLTNLGIQAEYPSGFEFIKAVPKSLEKTDWQISVLNKSQGGRIEITGILTGDIGEAKIFRAKLGIWQDGEFIVLKAAERGIEIIKPSIYLRQEINDNPQYAASVGEWLHYEIYFKNIGEDALDNLSMICKLDGEAFDFTSLKSDFGTFTAGDDSVIFDWRKISRLQYLMPTEEGKVDFWIKVKDDLGNIKNPVLKNKIFISQVAEEFITKISSKTEVVQRGYFQDEVFGNAGPIPPKVGETTTYTILWQVKNYYSNIKNAKVKAILPQGVSLTGKIFPEDAASKFSFDSASREIVWSVGDLERGVGVTGPGPNIAFQISFTPDASQRWQTPDIIGQVKISGEDSWTEEIMQSTAGAINTTLPDDSTMSKEKGIVQ